MTECPDRDCREYVLSEVQEAKDCAKKKVSQKAVWAFILVYGGALIASGVTIYAGQRDKADRDKVAEISAQVAEIAANQNSLRQSVDELRRTIQRNQDITSKQLDKMMELILKQIGRGQ